MTDLIKSLALIVGLIIFTAALIIAFEPPNNVEILAAIGSTNDLPDKSRRALSIDYFEPIPSPTWRLGSKGSPTKTKRY